MFKVGSKIVCIVNKRTAYSHLPKLTVGDTYTIKSIMIIRYCEHFELCEHVGFYFPFDHFNTVSYIRNKKLKQLKK